MLSYFCTYQKSILGDTNPISAEIPKATKQAAGKENGSVLPGLVSDSDESCHKAASEAGIKLSIDSKNYRKVPRSNASLLKLRSSWIFMPSSTQLRCQPVKIQVFLDLYAKQYLGPVPAC